MAGIFRNNVSESTSLRRIPLSPFCSPGQIPEVSMNNSYALGYKSPNMLLPHGSTSPSQGRSVREYEQQMSSLRNENFNLKLRLYFIEENSLANVKDENIKQLVDAKVELEILRKEVQEKQDLLKDAAQAMTQMEKIQKETETKSQAIIDELSEKIQFLEMEKDMEKSDKANFMNELTGRSDVSDNFNVIQKIRELEGALKHSEEKEIELQTKITKLENELLQRTDIIAECENKVKILAFQNAELIETLEAKEKEISNTEIQNLRKELDEQKKEIAYKGCLIQDGEEKIENLTKDYEKACKTIQKLMNHVKNPFEEKNKSKKSHEMLEDVSSTNTDTDIVSNVNFNDKLRKAQEKYEISEKWRAECAHLCSLLTFRLEELASFLNFLLKQKIVLGFLGYNRTKKMQAAVDCSFDLSKSFNTTLSANNVSNLDYSLTQLINLSEQFETSHKINRNSHDDGTFMEDVKDENETYQCNFENKLSKQLKNNSSSRSVTASASASASASALASESALESALESASASASASSNNLATKKDKKSLGNLNCQLESESEAWSEPDRKVSLQRIGLEELFKVDGTKSSIRENYSTDSCESSKLTPLHSSSKIQINNAISKLEENVKQKENQINNLQAKLCNNKKHLNKEQSTVSNLKCEIKKLNTKIEELTQKLESKSQKTNNKSTSTNDNNEFHSILSNNHELQQKIDEKNQIIEKIQSEHQQMIEEIQTKEKQIHNLKDEMKKLKIKYKHELLSNETKIEQFKKLSDSMEKRFQELKETHENDLKNNWIERSIYETKVKQLENEIHDAHKMIDDYNETEMQLKEIIYQNEEKIHELTLQISKIIIERSTALNDKIELENEIHEFEIEIANLKLERNSLKEKIILMEEKVNMLSNNSNLSIKHQSAEKIQKVEYYNPSIYHRICNKSPDLGIESDPNGHMSHVEEVKIDFENDNLLKVKMNVLSPNVNTFKYNSKGNSPSNIASTSKTRKKFDEKNNENNEPSSALNIVHNCAKVEQENSELRRKLVKTRAAFEDTYNKLKISNKRKEQVEKDIKNQIIKTQNVLKQARSNMEKEK